MLNRCILVSGSKIATDDELIAELQRHATVLKNTDNALILSIVNSKPVDLILLEVVSENSSELEAIPKLIKSSPDVAIVLIDGDRELLAKAFSYGVKDAFKKPYKRSLIVERVKAVLGGLDNILN